MAVTEESYLQGMTDEQEEAIKKLRAPFADGQIGKLPRVTCGKCRETRAKVCDEHRKQKCAECGNYMTTAHLHLDYVGHAQVTDRLLDADPGWWWEPVAWDTDGMPAIAVEQGGRRVLWIRLTVAGVTRLGVGIVDGNKPEAEKELIGDALRNAAMRFGVALDLWAKGDLHGDEDPPAPSDRQTEPSIDWQALGWSDQDAHDEALEKCRAVARRLPDPHRDNVKAWVKDEGGQLPYPEAFMTEWANMMHDLVTPAAVVDTADPTLDEGRPFTDDEPLPGVTDLLGS